MAYIIEKDEATAVRRRVPFHLFASNGTGPFTSGSNITMLGSVNGAAQLSLGSVSVVSANAGQYYFELSQSNVSVLGSIALYTDNVAHYPQHVANVQVVNNNPMSLQSGVIIAGGSYSSTTVRLDLVAYSGATVGAGNITPGVYSAVSLSVRDGGIYTGSVQAGNYSGVSVEIKLAGLAPSSFSTAGVFSHVTFQGVTRVNSSVTPADALYSAVTVRIDPQDYSGLTVGVDNIAAATYSGVTVNADNLGRRLYSDLTVRIEGVSYSGLTIDGTRFLSTAGERSAASSLLSSPMGNNRILQEYLWPLRNRVQISGSTGTVFLPDDATSSWTFSVTTAAFPLSGIDPGGT